MSGVLIDGDGEEVVHVPVAQYMGKHTADTDVKKEGKKGKASNEVAAARSIVPPDIAAKMKGWAVHRIGELRAWRGAETENESHAHHIVIAQNVSLIEFLKKVPERGIFCKIALVDGTVIIYEFQTKTHAKVIAEQLRQFGNFSSNNANNTLDVGDQIDVVLGVGSVQKPDGYVEPKGLPRRPPGQGMDGNDAGNTEPYPNLVFEVGVSETVDSLHSLAPLYFSHPRTTIRAYLAVKIWEQRNNGTFAALALFYLRTHVPNTTPVQAISFGTALIHGNALNTMPNLIPPLITGAFHGPAPQMCNAIGLAPFQINVPVAELYHGVPTGVPAGLPVNLQIDLFQVQRVAY